MSQGREECPTYDEKEKANLIGHISRRNWTLKNFTGRKTEGGIEVTGRRGRWRKLLLDDLKKTGGSWK
jgi:hypothetical protein